MSEHRAHQVGINWFKFKRATATTYQKKTVEENLFRCKQKTLN